MTLGDTALVMARNRCGRCRYNGCGRSELIKDINVNVSLGYRNYMVLERGIVTMPKLVSASVCVTGFTAPGPPSLDLPLYNHTTL